MLEDSISMYTKLTGLKSIDNNPLGRYRDSDGRIFEACALMLTDAFLGFLTANSRVKYNFPITEEFVFSEFNTGYSLGRLYKN